MQLINTLVVGFGLISAVASAATTTTCNANDCLRQVRASRFPTRAGTTDCQAFQTSTSTVISTVTTTTTAGAAVGKRAVVDPNDKGHVIQARQTTASSATIPAYASSCANPSQYASACRCIGVTSGVVTVTSTSTVTSTTTSATCPTATYAVQEQVAGAPGNFATLTQDFAISGASFLFDVTDSTVTQTSASKLVFVADPSVSGVCRLRAVGQSGTLSYVVDAGGFTDSHYLRITDPSTGFSGYKASPVYCSITAGSLLACRAVDSDHQSPDEVTLFNDDGRIRIGTADHATTQTYKLIQA